MQKPVAPGFSNIRIDEFAIWTKVTKDLTPESVLDLIQAVDDCLSIQKSSAIINRFAGKQKHNRKMARELIYDRMLQVEFIERVEK